MSQRHYPKINRVGAPRERASAQYDYSFVFSDNVADWQGSRKIKTKKRNYEKEKERNIINKLETIYQQKSDKLDTRAANDFLETQRKAKHSKYKPHTKGRAANLNP